MNNKLLLSAAVLSIAFRLSAYSVHKGMIKEDMAGKDTMTKDDMKKGIRYGVVLSAGKGGAKGRVLRVLPFSTLL